MGTKLYMASQLFNMGCLEATDWLTLRMGFPGKYVVPVTHLYPLNSKQGRQATDLIRRFLLEGHEPATAILALTGCVSFSLCHRPLSCLLVVRQDVYGTV